MELEIDSAIAQDKKVQEAIIRQIAHYIAENLVIAAIDTDTAVAIWDGSRQIRIRIKRPFGFDPKPPNARIIDMVAETCQSLNDIIVRRVEERFASHHILQKSARALLPALEELDQRVGGG